VRDFGRVIDDDWRFCAICLRGTVSSEELWVFAIERAEDAYNGPLDLLPTTQFKLLTLPFRNPFFAFLNRSASDTRCRLLPRSQAFLLQDVIRYHRALFCAVVVRISDMVDPQVVKARNAQDVKQQYPSRFSNERNLNTIKPEANRLTRPQHTTKHTNIMRTLLGAVGKRTNPVVHDVMPELREHPVQHEEDENPAEFWFGPVCWRGGRVVAVVVTRANHLPDPCNDQGNGYGGESDETALATAPAGVVEDGLEGPLTLVYEVSTCLTCNSYIEVTYSRRGFA
jgi:hypothetical protein